MGKLKIEPVDADVVRNGSGKQFSFRRCAWNRRLLTAPYLFPDPQLLSDLRRADLDIETRQQVEWRDFADLVADEIAAKFDL